MKRSRSRSVARSGAGAAMALVCLAGSPAFADWACAFEVACLEAAQCREEALALEVSIEAAGPMLSHPGGVIPAELRGLPGDVAAHVFASDATKTHMLMIAPAGAAHYITYAHDYPRTVTYLGQCAVQP